MTRPLDFYFFIGSTYTYLSVMRIEDLARRSGVEVRWRPFFLRTILLEQNNVPFIGKPAKLRYMWRDIERRAQRFGLEFNGVPPYPVDPDGLANHVAWLACSEGWGRDFVRAIYSDWFLRHEPPGDPDRTRDLLVRLGRDPDATLTMANNDDVQAAYLAATRAAAELGIFGSPTFVVGDEIFWGDDRLEDAMDWAVQGK